MRTWMLRLGLSLMVVVGFWTNPLPAQEILVVPTIPYEPAYQPPMPFPFPPGPRPGPADHHLRRVLNSHGMGCKDDPFYTTCGSLHYELRFIFGSCRSFFSQGCDPNQPCADKYRR
jgi:hypothetical protein